MADISAFPSITKVLAFGNNQIPMTAGEAITAGQVVGIAATGVSMTAVVMDATTGETGIGVALFSAASGAPVTVCGPGDIVYVANADDTTAIDAGSFVEQNDNAVGGTVSAVSVAATDGATVTAHYGVIGIALDDIAGGGTGRILIAPQSIVQANSL